MVRFGEIEIAKVTFYASKKPIKIWDVNVDDIVISKLVKTKTINININICGLRLN